MSNLRDNEANHCVCVCVLCISTLECGNIASPPPLTARRFIEQFPRCSDLQLCITHIKNIPPLFSIVFISVVNTADVMRYASHMFNVIVRKMIICPTTFRTIFKSTANVRLLSTCTTKYLAKLAVYSLQFLTYCILFQYAHTIIYLTSQLCNLLHIIGRNTL